MDKKKRFTLDKMTFLLFTIIPLVLHPFFYIISVVSGMYYSLTAVSYTHLDVYKRQGLVHSRVL